VTSIDQKRLPRPIGFFQLKLYSLYGFGSGNIPFLEIEERPAEFIPNTLKGKRDVSATHATLGWRRYLTTALSL
jgi:hypothetical protein